MRVLLFAICFGKLRRLYPEQFDGPTARRAIEAVIAVYQSSDRG